MTIGERTSITTTGAPISNTALIIVAMVRAKRIVRGRINAEKAESQCCDCPRCALIATTMCGSAPTAGFNVCFYIA